MHRGGNAEDRQFLYGYLNGKIAHGKSTLLYDGARQANTPSDFPVILAFTALFDLLSARCRIDLPVPSRHGHSPIMDKRRRYRKVTSGRGPAKSRCGKLRPDDDSERGPLMSHPAASVTTSPLDSCNTLTFSRRRWRCHSGPTASQGFSGWGRPTNDAEPHTWENYVASPWRAFTTSRPIRLSIVS